MRSRLLPALCLFVLVCTSQQGNAQFLSPGPLARDHQQVDGEGACNRCHESGRRISTTGCLSCHEDLGARIRQRKGLHGDEYRGRDCGPCHVDHLGRNARLVRWPEGRMESFDHDLSGWPLRGAHRQEECRGCHDRRNSRGHPTFLGAPVACVGCHEDPHQNRFGRECQSCHNETDWSQIREGQFDHNRTRFPLRGEHRQVECRECHHEPPQWRGLNFASCANCHEDPHRGRLGPNCSTCHDETAWTSVERVQQSHPGVSLGGGHANVQCRTCHDQGLDRVPSSGRGCVSCHAPVHEAPFGRRCEQCHTQIRWLGLPRPVGLRSHEQTHFQLVGAHTEVACDGCHKSSMPRAQRYRGLEFERCSDCHESPHPGWNRFADTDCQYCHDERAFRPSTFGVTQHARASFAIDGRHRAVPCQSCHGNARPRTDFRLERSRCADCHENPHGNQFDREMRAGGCESCHRPQGWDRPSISHDTWPLTGAHSETSCDSCHSPSEADRRSGRGASYRGVPRECEGCHADSHAGQFRLTSPAKSCNACHNTTRFTPIRERFDHTANTGFVLDGQHAPLECEACHRTEQLRNGSETVRWRLGYRACSDCHADPHSSDRAEGER